MIRDLFDLLYKSLYSTPLIAITGSFVWGILSILLSPCHLASIPLIVGFIDEQGNKWLGTDFDGLAVFREGGVVF